MNNRVKKIRITFGDGTSYIKTLDDGYENRKNDIYFDETVTSDIVTIEIISVYRGNDDCNDTCISEISIID